MVASHRSMEMGHQIALDCLGKKPLLDLDMRLGEGTGAALSMNLVEAAVRILTEVATFEEAAVSKADKSNHNCSCILNMMIRPLLAAIQFLTVIPFSKSFTGGEKELEKCMPFFPVVGLLIGIIIAAFDHVIGLIFPLSLQVF